MRKGVARVMEIAAGVRLVAFDCDGVLTDGRIGYAPGPNGPEGYVTFHTRDGHGFRLLREAGIATAWVSGNRHPTVAERARRLRIPHVRLSTDEKDETVRSLAAELHLELGRVAFVGDDVNDLPAMAIVGLPIAVADADWEVRARAAYVTVKRGGHGAAREVADLILAAKGRT